VREGGRRGGWEGIFASVALRIGTSHVVLSDPAGGLGGMRKTDNIICGCHLCVGAARTGHAPIWERHLTYGIKGGREGGWEGGGRIHTYNLMVDVSFPLTHSHFIPPSLLYLF